MDIGKNYLESIRWVFRYYKSLGEKAITQLEEKELFYRPDPESNSVALIVKHISGNMLSRWTDFLTSDGEKPWRDRESEFLNDLKDREAVLAVWEKGWTCLFEAVESLVPDDLQRIVYIRNEGHSVIEAINRQVGHYSYHVGQLVYLAKHLKGDQWASLSIPKGGTKAFNEEKFNKEKERRFFYKGEE